MTQALIARLAEAELWATQNKAPASVIDTLREAADDNRKHVGTAVELEVSKAMRADVEKRVVLVRGQLEALLALVSFLQS